jgi:hypothetical protein
MTITLLQTADPLFYYPMLQETSRTVRAYCALHGFRYEQYVGIKRGHMPWQASYNRIDMLKEMVDRGVKGWVLYLDADAFIQDFNFDLCRYFEERSHAAAIFAGYSTCDIPYDINSGGFAINLSHPIGKGIVIDWHRAIDVVSAEVFDGAVHWEHDLANDQHLLVCVIQRYLEELRVSDSLIFERANQSYVNNGPFVSQFLRSMFPGYKERFAAVKQRVAEIMSGRSSDVDEAPGVYMRADHPKLVTSCGRKTSAGITSTGKEGGLMFGPYIRLDAGRYVARIIGKVGLGAQQPAASFHSDVAIDRGYVVLAAKDVRHDGPVNGVISELIFELDEDTDSLEVRVVVGSDVDMTIRAIQIADA